MDALNGEDFSLWFKIVSSLHGLGIYNYGTEAGASQRLLHFQVVPLTEIELKTGERGPPFDKPIKQALFMGYRRVPTFTFPHAIASVLPHSQGGEEGNLLEVYEDLIWKIGIVNAQNSPYSTQRLPHNVVLTKDWMLVVPRTRSGFAGIEVNGFGFAGLIFADDEKQLGLIQKIGPMGLLHAISDNGTFQSLFLQTLPLLTPFVHHICFYVLMLGYTIILSRSVVH